MSVRVFPIPVGELRGWWPMACGFIEQALEHSDGEMTLEDVATALGCEDMYLLVAVRDPALDDAEVVGAFTAMVVDYHQRRSLRVVHAAGAPMSAWIEPLIAKLEEGCEVVGATRIEIFGRPGLTRALKQYTSEQYTVMVRKVNHEHGRQQGRGHHDLDEESMGTGSAGSGERCYTGLAEVGAKPTQLHRAKLHRPQREHERWPVWAAWLRRWTGSARHEQRAERVAK